MRVHYTLHLIGTVRSVIRNCVTCKRVHGKPCPQLLGQLLVDRLNPSPIFRNLGVDYVGPVVIKSGSIRKPVITKAYVCVFVCFLVRAVHLELVSNLTTASFIATLRRFVSRRGKPATIWSDHGTNLIWACREMKEVHAHLKKTDTEEILPTSARNEVFSGTSYLNMLLILVEWGAAIKSFKHHFHCVVGDVCLSYKELTTLVTQTEVFLNSRPLMPLPQPEDDIEALTPGHFLIGGYIKALQDPPQSFHNLSLLQRWHCCQTLVRQLWKRLSTEYLRSL